jgi:hypothetical protein
MPIVWDPVWQDPLQRLDSGSNPNLEPFKEVGAVALTTCWLRRQALLQSIHHIGKSANQL